MTLSLTYPGDSVPHVSWGLCPSRILGTLSVTYPGDCGSQVPWQLRLLSILRTPKQLQNTQIVCFSMCIDNWRVRSFSNNNHGVITWTIRIANAHHQSYFLASEAHSEKNNPGPLIVISVWLTFRNAPGYGTKSLICRAALLSLCYNPLILFRIKLGWRPFFTFPTEPEPGRIHGMRKRGSR